MTGRAGRYYRALDERRWAQVRRASCERGVWRQQAQRKRLTWRRLFANGKAE